MGKIITTLIRLYQMSLSHIFGGCCRFHPSCSAYAIEAVESHGWLRGSFLAFRRLCKCQPLHGGGYDPVPPVSPRGT